VHCCEGPVHDRLARDRAAGGTHVFEGTIRFETDGRYVDAPSGAFMFIPRGTAQFFQNVGHGDARLLVMFAPAGWSASSKAMPRCLQAPPDPEVYRQVAHAAWMEAVGPPMAPGERGGE
jgi:hypothetical protein